MSVQSSAIISIQSLQDGKVEIKCKSPSKLPVGNELRYSVPSKLVSEFEVFFNKADLINGASRVIFDYVHPTNATIPIVFKTVRLEKNNEPGYTSPQYSIHLHPVKDTAYSKGMKEDVTISDFTSPYFAIRLDTHLAISNSATGQRVMFVEELFDDRQMVSYLTPENTVRPINWSENEEASTYTALGLPTDTIDMKKTMIFYGNVVDIKHKGTDKESMIVDFDQVIPANKDTFVKHGGAITNIETCILSCYDETYGWQRHLVESQLSNLLRNSLLSQTEYTYYKDFMMSTFFGKQPVLLHRSLRVLPDYSKSSETSKPLRYETRGTQFVLRIHLPSDQLLPVGAQWDITKSAEFKSVSRLISTKTTPHSGPFDCAIACAKSRDCDFYSQNNKSCSMYSMDKESSAKLKAKLGKLYDTKTNFVPVSELKSGDWKMLKKHAITSGYQVDNNEPIYSLSNVWSNFKMVTMKDFEPTMKRIRDTNALAADIRDELKNSALSKEMFKNKDVKVTNQYLDSAIRSYKISHAQAKQSEKELELADAQKNFTGRNTIYYNLFTTALWIINIACLIGIFYILIVGFSGSEMSLNMPTFVTPTPSMNSPQYSNE